MGALTFNWLDRLGPRRHRGAPVSVPLIASRDLPPAESLTRPPLPRSPEPMPDEALVFAQGAARRPLPDLNDEAGMQALQPVASIATGADLRAMLERFERAHRRRQALDHAVQARARLVERLAAGRAAIARPSLVHVGAEHARPARTAAEEEKRLDRAMEDALATALVTLKRLSATARN